MPDVQAQEPEDTNVIIDAFYILEFEGIIDKYI
jgi:hypothetical protein